MNSPREGSSVKPFTPFPVLSTNCNSTIYSIRIRCLWHEKV